MDRESLSLQSIVAEEFGFLDQYGFAVVHSEATQVRLKARSIYINIYHGRRSFGVGLEVGSLLPGSKHSGPYSMAEIVRLMEPERDDSYRDFVAESVGAVRIGVSRLSSRFRCYVREGLLKRANLFEELSTSQEQWKRDLQSDSERLRDISAVELAWKIKDYATVERVLSTIEKGLPLIEQKRLKFARKKLALPA